MSAWQEHSWIAPDGLSMLIRKIAFTDDGVVLHRDAPAARMLEVPRARRQARAGTFRWAHTMTEHELHQDYEEGRDVVLVGDLRVKAFVYADENGQRVRKPCEER